MDRHAGGTRRKPRISAYAAAALAALAGATGAAAAKVSVACETSDTINSAWGGPMTIEYEGAETGTLTLRSAFGDLTLPATMKAHVTQVGEGQAIEGFGAIQTTMPDLALLEACIATKIPPGAEGDADAYDGASMQCLAATPPAPGPVAVTAQVKLGIFPGEPPGEYGLVIEVKRTYAQKTKSPRGSTSIDSFPAKCTLAGKQ